MQSSEDERYLAEVERALDGDASADLFESLLVHADRLQLLDDPRGLLITLEAERNKAVRDDDRARVRALDAEILEHSRTNRRLFGRATDLFAVRRALTLGWRAGYVFEATIDLRRVPEAKMAFLALVGSLLRTPAMSRLRRLRVRLRQQVTMPDLVALVRTLTTKPPLDTIAIGKGPRPVRLAGGNVPDTVAFAFPHLFHLSLEDSIHTLAENADDRTRLGRGLLARDRRRREDALAKLAPKDVAFFAPTLTLLLEPNLLSGEEARAVLRALSRLGPSAASLAHAVAKVAARASYDLETRRAAGRTLAALRGESAKSDDRRGP